MRLRAPVPDDAPAVLAVLVAREMADLGMADDALGDVLDEWRGSDLDLAEDARAAETPDGGIVAYVVVRRPGTLTAVHPDHEGRGIGTRLLDWDVVRDAVSLHALDARSFAANPGYAAESLREFCEEHLEAHAFDASLSRVAEEGEDIVGFLIARRWEDEAVGYVDLLAVDPDHQGRCLGTALLGSGFAAFASAGLREAQLGVDSNNPRALKVYERAGMRVSFRYDVYERPMAASAGAL